MTRTLPWKNLRRSDRDPSSRISEAQRRAFRDPHLTKLNSPVRTEKWAPAFAGATIGLSLPRALTHMAPDPRIKSEGDHVRKKR